MWQHKLTKQPLTSETATFSGNYYGWDTCARRNTASVELTKSDFPFHTSFLLQSWLAPFHEVVRMPSDSGLRDVEEITDYGWDTYGKKTNKKKRSEQENESVGVVGWMNMSLISQKKKTILFSRRFVRSPFASSCLIYNINALRSAPCLQWSYRLIFLYAITWEIHQISTENPSWVTFAYSCINAFERLSKTKIQQQLKSAIFHLFTYIKKKVTKVSFFKKKVVSIEN